jgi:hypothetical protein
MQNANNGQIYLKMFLYIFVTMVISFLSLLDTVTNVDAMTKLEWFKLVSKASVPALISLKAYLDTSSSVNTEVKKDN